MGVHLLFVCIMLLLCCCFVDSFLIRIEWILSNNSEEQLSMSWRKKKEWEQRN